MKKFTVTMPHLRDTLTDTLDNYPQGFMLGHHALIREFWAPNHPEVLANPEEVYEVTYPSYGVITFRGRKYTFVLTAEYARAKGYPQTIEGSWG
jgi:hypothetical protein